MANRPVLRRRGTQPSKPVVEDVEDDVEEYEDDDQADDDAEEVEDDDQADDDAEDDDDEEEEEVVVRRKVAVPVAGKKVVAPPAVKKKVVVAPPPVVKKVVKPVLVEEDMDDDADADEEVVVKKTVVKPVDATAAGANMLELLDSMADGQSLVITRNNAGKWTFSTTDAIAAASKPAGLRGNAYWDEVISPEFRAWYADWHNLTQDERIRTAKKNGVTWKEDKDPRVNIMRATAAYREAMGIEKYKPEYRSRSERAKLQGK